MYFPMKRNYSVKIYHEKEFKEQFVTVFLATYAANNYAECCMLGDHTRIEHPPVEDAMHLANCAWNETKNHVDYWLA